MKANHSEALGCQKEAPLVCDVLNTASQVTAKTRLVEIDDFVGSNIVGS